VGEWLPVFSTHLDPPRRQEPLNHLTQHHFPKDLNRKTYSSSHNLSTTKQENVCDCEREKYLTGHHNLISCKQNSLTGDNKQLYF